MSWLSQLIDQVGGRLSEISDKTFLEEIDKTKLLAQISKDTYKRKAVKVCETFFPTKVSIWWVIHHPDEMKSACLRYVKKRKVAQETLAQYMVPFMYLLGIHRELQENDPKLKRHWMEIREEIREPPADLPVKENQPTEKQEKANMSFDKICKIRDQLPDGSDGRLLLSFYTILKPLRSDFNCVRIYFSKPKEKDDGNYIVLGDVNKLYLSEYKTAERYGTEVLKIPDELLEQIKTSLKRNPREYLFVNRFGEPYNDPANFGRWANKAIRNLLNNDHISLTTFRHIYLSQTDLDIKNMPYGERKKLAHEMGHSVAMQGKYVWKDKEDKGKEPKK